MIKGITNNKILESCLTDKFLDSLEMSLMPVLSEKYGDEVRVVMYEDHLAEKMLIGGYWYYPLTVLLGSSAKTEWIRWQVASKNFKDNNPYAYIGDELTFELTEMPAELSDKFSGYLGYSGNIGIRVDVEAVSRDITFLSGRYSQRFVDELSRQITEKMSALMTCSGIKDSSLSLLLTFAPESYFEHTSENVTYRRLLLIDKGSQPRDFWVKWTRLNAAVGYSVSDDVSAEDIEFDLGEDVSQKIREKEYRFLLREGREKYQNSMGRRNVTEWREIIRRAIKRGELTKVEPKRVESEIVFEDDLSAKLKDILGDSYKLTPSAESVVEEAPMGDDYIKALEIAKEYVGEEKDTSPENTEIPPELEESTELFLPYGDDEDEKEVSIDIFDMGEELEISGDMPSLFELDDEPLTLEAGENPLFDEQPVPEEEPEFEVELVPEVEPEIEAEPEVESEPAPEAEPEVETEPEEAEEPAFGEAKVRVIKTWGAPMEMGEGEKLADRLREAESRAGEYSIRLEYEKQMRAKLEEEVARLRAAEVKLSAENDALREQIKADEAKCREIEESLKLEIASLRAQNEVLSRSEERQKERLATAARDAVERQRELEAERRRIEEENARLARENNTAPAPIFTDEPTPVAVAAAVSAPEIAPAVAPEVVPEPEIDNYNYVSKNVKLLFRRPTDPNITTRIYEIVKATIEHFGKEKVKIHIKASMPDSETVNLQFAKIPLEEMQLLSSIIQVLGSSGLGIAKAIVE